MQRKGPHLLSFVLACSFIHGVIGVGCANGYSGQDPDCTLCRAGYWCAGGGLIMCGTGKYSSEGASVCTKCSKGTYAKELRLTACTDCSTGTFASATGLSACATCATGRYASDTGLSVCDTCATGMFASTTGLSVCATCAVCSAGKHPLIFKLWG